jgi:hypothetical protein
VIGSSGHRVIGKTKPGFTAEDAKGAEEKLTVINADHADSKQKHAGVNAGDPPQRQNRGVRGPRG